MLSHAQVWAAIDGLARRYGLSPSGLAKRAGLDPTTFNPSKRFAGDGRPRWPSTESLAKILEATGEPVEAFVATLATGKEKPAPASRMMPCTGFSEASRQEAFDTKGLPSGSLWGEIAFPDPANKGLFALEVSGDDQLPIYRAGDVLIIAPLTAVRRGDRVLAKIHGRGLSILTMERRTQAGMQFSALDQPSEAVHLAHDQIEWLGRILWASQ
ncbi:S24 family peptidase [Roseibium suaedae]|uniref:Phage repressor protein C, contains Cro/C1-type HTH and peptisase s24 domains n=1 Tax=Roseibium suaedae TaxID=735517 RepID=A0A1M7BDP0_9HYPH|nr:helix-turn-helix transcriptional regulator [Roseibium suaedae]SHL53148.1 Phage repressor protein C, contains Cro/C1-type HTH and peptisase s24 domains [Roseibium suaedae]